MKFEFNKKYFSISIYVLLVIVLSIVCYDFIQNIDRTFGLFSKIIGMIKPFIYGFIIAYLLNPLLRWFDREITGTFKGRIVPKYVRMISVFFTYIISGIFLLAFFAIVIPQVASSVTSIFSKSQQFIYNAEIWINEVLQKYPEIFARIQFSEVSDMINYVVNIVSNAIPSIFNLFLDATSKITSGIIEVVVGIIVSIYMLVNKEILFAQIKKVLYAFFPNLLVDKTVEITRESHSIFSGFIIGKLIDSAIIGVICFVSLSILKFEYALLISLIIGVTNVIPYFGPFIGAIPASIIVLMVDPKKTIIFLIFILLLQQFDGNILGPKILGQSTGISGMWVIFAILLFGGLLKLPGMFIGVPLFATLYCIFKKIVNYNLMKKNMSINTRDYCSEKHRVQ